MTNAVSSIDQSARDLLASAVTHIQQLRDRLERQEKEPIAIVGMACRLPGDIDSPQAFWHFLCAGGTTVNDQPPARMDWTSYKASWPGQRGKTYTTAGSYMASVDQFDPGFFALSQAEADALDPQHRLLLEECWLALEDAGLPPSRLDVAATGLIASFGESNYAELGSLGTKRASQGGHEKLGVTKSIGVGRVGHFLGLQGPSFEIDTSCSSSLVAVDLACGLLRSGRARFMLVGASNLILTPTDTIGFAGLRALSPSGCPAPFQERADGYVRGEGCGVVVLAPLWLAREMSLRVHALVLGSAVNSDGRSNGLTAPSGVAQEAVIRQALAAADVAASEVAYVETHGTGTKLGDPIEAAALARVYGAAGAAVSLGALKGNIGHLETAAGVMSLVKAVLALRHGVVPGNRLVDQASSLIDWQYNGLTLPGAAKAWPAHLKRRYAAVSAFGMSGTNAHLLLAADETTGDAPAVAHPASGPAHVLTVSAASRSSLEALIEAHQQTLAVLEPEQLAGYCAAAATTREALAWRCAVVGDCTESLAAQLRDVQGQLASLQPQRAPEALCLPAGTDPGLIDLARRLTALPVRVAGAGDGLVGHLAVDPANDLPAVHRTVELAAMLFRRGAPVDWTPIYHARSTAESVGFLPLYRFARRRCWLAETSPAAPISVAPDAAAELGRWPSRSWVTADHRLFGRSVVPGARLLAVAMSCLRSRFGQQCVRLFDVEFVQAVTEQTSGDVVLRATADIANASLALRIESADDDHSVYMKARASLLANSAIQGDPRPAVDGIDGVDGIDVKSAMSAAGFELEREYRRLSSLRRAPGRWTCRLRVGGTAAFPEEALSAQLDAVFQGLGAVFYANDEATQRHELLVPSSIDELVVNVDLLPVADLVLGAGQVRSTGTVRLVKSGQAWAADALVCGVRGMSFTRGLKSVLVPSQVSASAQEPPPGATATREAVTIEALQAIVQEALVIDEVLPGDAPLRELGLDSLATFELRDAVQKRWQVEPPTRDELPDLTVTELHQAIRARVQAAASVDAGGPAAMLGETPVSAAGGAVVYEL